MTGYGTEGVLQGPSHITWRKKQAGSHQFEPYLFQDNDSVQTFIEDNIEMPRSYFTSSFVALTIISSSCV